MNKNNEISENAGKKSSSRALTALLIFLFICLGLFAFDRPNFYLWAKAIHVMAVIAWMAGMFYMPRLFVYHADSEPGSEKSETFKVMETRLMKVIMNPAMILTWIFGLYLVFDGGWLADGWLHVKLLAIVLMSGVHGYYSKAIKDFARDGRKTTARHWRIVNEIPTVLMIIAVIMVILKPF
ncbi:protoporphyrinogen oxidase HemJ [Martelella mediterranea]|uniref:Protoporphyrinogen IX oxidase n=1 Tax=Martelella mediterranea TaxID=293089 RepID=A0A4R3NY17_9HYPH|nr:protoporphyrinogen oxidase HemJ [Martelella mediterranea]TCT44680.1 putative membrane protein [Martelella mediterranea]